MKIQSPQEQILALPTGTVIRVSHGWYDHVGLLGDSLLKGERSVVAFSSKDMGFVEQPYSAFSQGRQVTSDGYLGSLPSAAVMQRSRLKKGTPYSWINFNCEHFVRYAHGVQIESPQVKQWTILGSVAGLAFLSVRG